MSLCPFHVHFRETNEYLFKSREWSFSFVQLIEFIVEFNYRRLVPKTRLKLIPRNNYSVSFLKLQISFYFSRVKSPSHLFLKQLFNRPERLWAVCGLLLDDLDS